MHLIFERSNGRIRSNCNILALAWMPYYVETKFRQALLDYHQKQLMNLGRVHNLQRNHHQHMHGYRDNLADRINQAHQNLGVNNSHNNLAHEEQIAANSVENNGNSNNRTDDLVHSVYSKKFLNSRLTELYKRYIYAKVPNINHIGSGSSLQVDEVDKQDINDSMNNELGQKYGRLNDFGWLVIGNVGKTIGVTLTSIVPPPHEKNNLSNHPSKRDLYSSVKQNNHRHYQNGQHDGNVDLMVFDDDDDSSDDRLGTRSNANSNQDQGTNEISRSTMPTATQSLEYENLRPDKKCKRSNYNLGGHMDEIILVRWNELFQKLATVDSKGNVLIWCKINEKFTIQTPFYNRTKSVADFCWSNDGKTALICYTDSFILIGSSSGQRHWHSMLNLDEYHITCASWTPNDDQLLLGVSNGNIVVIDLPQSELTELVVSQVNIRTICWSTYGMNLNHSNNVPSNATINEHDTSRDSHRHNYRRDQKRQLLNTTIVNQRRLSRDCSVFSSYRFSFRPPNSGQNVVNVNSNDGPQLVETTDKQQSIVSQKNILAVEFADNTIKLYDGGLEDPEPRLIRVNLESFIMSWSSDGKLLAVVGFNIQTSAMSVGCLRCRYLNSIKFYNQQAELVYEYALKYTKYPITAFTWAHNDQRIFVATGPRLHCARLFRGIPSLGLLALSRLYQETRLAHKYDALECLIGTKFSHELKKWQSSTCPIKHKIGRLRNDLPTQDRSSSLTTDDSNDDILELSSKLQINNANTFRYELPLKLNLELNKLFCPTIRRPIDDQLSLTDIIWHVPKYQQRHYCTLICYTSERMDRIDTNGLFSPHQYRTGEIEKQSISQTTDQYKLFVLYIEFEGSLIPILRARRIGYLKPEFVIFDPEDAPMKMFPRNPKVSDISQVLVNGQSRRHPSTSSATGDLINNYLENCSDLHTQSSCSTNNDLNEISCGRNSSLTSVEHYYNFDQSDSKVRQQNQQDKLTNNLRYLNQNCLLNDPYLLFLLNINQQRLSNCKAHDANLTTHQNELKLALERYRSICGVNYSSTNQSRTLPETNELVRIRSNVWGTRFKIINVGNRMISQRVVLGTVTYKASLLHLQPRQIFLNIRDMSNYCSLCSILHHTNHIVRRKDQSISVRAPQNVTAESKGFDLVNSGHQSFIDTQIAHFATPSSSDRSSQRANKNGNGESKVVLLVGDSLKIAPKLDHNQRYKQVSKGEQLSFNLVDQQRPSTSKRFNNIDNYTSRATNSPIEVDHKRNVQYHPASNISSNSSVLSSHKRHRHHSNSNRLNSSARENPYSCVATGTNLLSPGEHPEATSLQTDTSDTGCIDDDILTLSLVQGDQVRVEMSSLSRSNKQQTSPPPPPPRAHEISAANSANQQLDEFLDSNKTLKSIQTITKMIVDLSSRVGSDDNDDERNDVERLNSSPSKIIKLSNDSECEQDTSLKPITRQSVSSKFIPPETPVHRPRKTVAAAAAAANKSQSANTTPLKYYSHLSRRRDHWAHRFARTSANEITKLQIEEPVLNPLPAPPQPVPISRRITSTAKRFIDGSLRSLYNASGSSSGFSSIDPDPDEYEPLVSAHQVPVLRRHQSQPCTPIKSHKPTNLWFRTNTDDGSKQPTDVGSDLESFREQLIKRLRNSTSNWRSSSNDNEGRCKTTSSSRVETPSKMTQNSQSRSKSTARSQDRRAHKPVLKSASRACSRERDPKMFGQQASTSDDFNDESSDFSSSSSDSFSSISNSIDVADSPSFKKSYGSKKRLSFSARALDQLDKLGNEKGRANSKRNNNQHHQQHDNGLKKQKKGNRRRQRRKSICLNSNCCCANEFKLNNRPPVWNEQSQVYQLDFGGRVTQESAKNLQIDFDGNLALQFGRIDQCTYTLDFKYPFNAVQAMSIALASLTQRMK